MFSLIDRGGNMDTPQRYHARSSHICTYSNFRGATAASHLLLHWGN